MVEGLMREISAEFPDFKVVPKDESGLMKFLRVLLLIVTFGALRNFMTDVVTTIGNTVYVPAGWTSKPEVGRYEVLRHERVHMRQRRRYGRVLYSFLYIFPFFPLFLAYWRAKLEMEAYAESIMVVAEIAGPGVVQTQEFKDRMASHFLNGSYGWAWPFRKTVNRWVDEAVQRAVQSVSEKKQ
jgi:hypothetical protein